MATLNISLPDDMRVEVDAQATARGYASASEYVRDLIRRDLDRQVLRDLLDEGRGSAPGRPISGEAFAALRQRAVGKPG